MPTTATISTAYGDKILVMSANKLVRKFDHPTGATDLRVIIPVRFAGSDQSFSSTTSIYETLRVCFTTGEDVVPGITGEYIGIGHQTGSAAGIAFGGFTGLSNVHSTSNISRLYNLTTNVPTSTALTTDISYLSAYSDSVYSENWILRLVKSSTDTILFETYGGSDGLPYSDLNMNSRLTSLGTASRRHSYTFATTEARDTVFVSMNTIFFATPWSITQLQIPGMGYRVI